MGIYPDAPPIPCVVGYEVSGTIDALGAPVLPFRLDVSKAAASELGFTGSVQFGVLIQEGNLVKANDVNPLSAILTRPRLEAPLIASIESRNSSASRRRNISGLWS